MQMNFMPKQIIRRNKK